MTTAEFAGRIQAMIPALHSVCYALVPSAQDREDAVQECLLKAWRKLPSLREERYFGTWVVRILINECHTITRRRRLMTLDALPERAAPPGADPALHDALMMLPEQLRLPIVLHYLSGYPVSDVARMLRLPEGTVKSRMRKARSLLRATLEEEGVRA